MIPTITPTETTFCCTRCNNDWPLDVLDAPTDEDGDAVIDVLSCPMCWTPEDGVYDYEGKRGPLRDQWKAHANRHEHCFTFTVVERFIRPVKIRVVADTEAIARERVLAKGSNAKGVVHQETIGPTHATFEIED